MIDWKLDALTIGGSELEQASPIHFLRCTKRWSPQWWTIAIPQIRAPMTSFGFSICQWPIQLMARISCIELTPKRDMSTPMWTGTNSIKARIETDHLRRPINSHWRGSSTGFCPSVVAIRTDKGKKTSAVAASTDRNLNMWMCVWCQDSWWRKSACAKVATRTKQRQVRKKSQSARFTSGPNDRDRS